MDSILNIFLCSRFVMNDCLSNLRNCALYHFITHKITWVALLHINDNVNYSRIRKVLFYHMIFLVSGVLYF